MTASDIFTIHDLVRIPLVIGKPVWLQLTFLKQGSGVIVSNLSASGLYGGRAGVAYTASKHAVVGLTKNTAFMFADKGIRCNGIAH